MFAQVLDLRALRSLLSFFSYLNAHSISSIHWKSLTDLRHFMEGKWFYLKFEVDLPKGIIQVITFNLPLIVLKLYIFGMTLTFFGFVSILLSLIMKPIKHSLGAYPMLNFLIVLKISLMPSRCSSYSFNLSIISCIWGCTLLPIHFRYSLWWTSGIPWIRKLRSNLKWLTNANKKMNKIEVER